MSEASQVIIHQEYQDKLKTRKVRTVQSYRLLSDGLTDPVEREFENKDLTKVAQTSAAILKNNREEEQRNAKRRRSCAAPQSKPKEDFSLYEGTESVKALWEQLVLATYKREVGFVTEVSLKEVQAWLVKEGIAGDREKAKTAIENEIGKLSMAEQGIITYDEFNRLFAKGVLRKAIVDVAEKFTALMKLKGDNSEGMPLGRKIDQYARSHMI